MKYNIELDESQIKLVANALELYTRLSIGQLDTIIDLPTIKETIDKRFEQNELYKNYYDNPISSNLNLTKIELNGSIHGNLGIFNKDVTEDVRIASHIKDTIKHQLYLDTENKNMGVYSYPADVVKDLVIKIY